VFGAGTLEITALARSTSINNQTMIATLILWSVMSKSAQFPFFTWLADAMAGPTPVSALLHAATMVAAGVFLLARVYFLFPPAVLTAMAAVGAVTAIAGALQALWQTDIKKILAYSTVSQLGLMVLALGAGAWAGGIMHLFTHAFFKACLFLAAGAVIHTLHHGHAHVQPAATDIRYMGGLRNMMPGVFAAAVLAAGGLAGVPLLAGFVSKEAIAATLLRQAQQSNQPEAWLWLAVFFAASFLTALYAFRWVWYIFIGRFRGSEENAAHHSAPPAVMVAPIVLLATATLWWIVGTNPFSASALFAHLNLPPASAGFTLFSCAWVVVALVFAFFRYRHHPLAGGQQFSFIDRVINRLFVQPALRLSNGVQRTDRHVIDGLLHRLAYVQVALAFITAWGDKTIVDGMAVGAAKVTRAGGLFFRLFAAGNIQRYIAWAIMIICLYIFWLLVA